MEKSMGDSGNGYEYGDPQAFWEEEAALAPSKTEGNGFADAIDTVLEEIRTVLVAKNESYGDAARNPIRAFSKAEPDEQIRVRIDDKLSRLIRGNDFATEDTVLDLLGYLVILRSLEVRK